MVHMQWTQQVKKKDGFLIYSIILGMPEIKFYKVIVDHRSGLVLAPNEMLMMDWMMTMHTGQQQEKGMMGGMHVAMTKRVIYYFFLFLF